MNANEEFIESRLLTPERPMSPVPPRKLPPLLDFSKIDNDENNEEEEEEEVSFVNPGSSPAGPLPFFDPPAKSVIAHEAEIQVSHVNDNTVDHRTMMKCCCCRYGTCTMDYGGFCRSELGGYIISI